MEVKVERYALKWGFMFEVVEEQDHFEMWLYHKDIGIKEMIIGAKDVDEIMSYAHNDGFFEHLMSYHERFMD